MPRCGPPSSLRRLALTLAGAAVLALIVLVAASARTLAPSKYGGMLVVGLAAGDPGNLDPTVNRLPAVNNNILAAMCLQLYDTNRKLQRVPVLAAAMPAVSKDKLTYTVPLRRGVLFNDGTPFNAQAVLTTIDRYRTYPESAQASKYASVESVTASGPYTVVFRLKARDAALFSNPMFILSPTELEKAGDGFGAHPVCAGPFMLDDRVAGDRITLVKSAHWYDRKNVFLDKIVFKFLPIAATAVAALKAGDIQALDRVGTTELESVRQSSSLRVIQGYQLGWTGIQINIGNSNGTGTRLHTNVGTPLSRSAKLRQAFEEAIDRDALNKVIYGGLMQVTCNLIPPANIVWYEATKVPCTPYDPAHARKLVAESGYENPTVRLLTSTTTDTLKRAEYIQAVESKVGINVVIDPVDAAAALKLRTNGDFDAYLGGLNPGGLDPTNTIRVASWDSANYPGYSNPQLDLILRNGVKATTQKARSALYRAAQRIILADRPYIALFNPSNFAAFSANVTGVELSADGLILVAHARYR